MSRIVISKTPLKSKGQKMCSFPFCCFRAAFLSHTHLTSSILLFFCCRSASSAMPLILSNIVVAPQIIFFLSGDHIFRIRFVHGNNFSWPLSGNSVINDLTVRIVKFVVPSHSEGWIFIQLLNFIKSYFTRLNPSTHVKKSCTAQKLKIS